MDKWKHRKEILLNRLIFILLIILTISVANLIYSYKKMQSRITNIKIVKAIHIQPKTKALQEPQMPKYNLSLKPELQKYTWDLCRQYKLDYESILALMYQESKFDIYAVNKNNNSTKDEGICQLNEVYSRGFANRAGISPSRFNPYNPYHNIKTCIVHIYDLKQSWINTGYKDSKILFWLVCGSYNKGCKAMQTYIKKTSKIKTDYAEQILKYKKILKKEGKLD